jgi:hypothetical protein
VLRTTNNNAVWAYDGSAWGSDGGWDDDNGMLSSAYATSKFSRMKITMNGKTHTWRLKPEYRNKVTLKDVVGEGTLGHNYKKTIFEPDAHGWVGKKSNPWGFTDHQRDGHENFVCHEMQGDYRYYDSSHAWARLGWSMSQEYSCGHPGTSEGIGLWEQGTNPQGRLASGRQQHDKEHDTFKQADIWVYVGPQHVSAPDKYWQSIIRTTDNNDVWSYTGSAWTDDPDGFDNEDGFLSPLYSSMLLQQGIKISMNGHEHTFELKSQYRNQVTLEDMATGPFKTEYFHEKGWVGTRTQPFGHSKTGHEFYVCHPLSCNFRYYENSGGHNVARIGWSESQEYGCSHPGTAEGLGLGEQTGSDRHFYTWLASGRLQHGSETRTFSEATVLAR